MASATIMDGRGLANEIKAEVKFEVEKLNSDGIDVGLAIMLVGNNRASKQYFFSTLKAAKGVGITVYEYKLPEDVTVNKLLNVINSINSNERVNGLLVLFPLPRRINPRRIVNAIAAEKDIDGLGSVSVGRLAAEESMFQIFKNKADGVTVHGHFFKKSPECFPLLPSSFLPCTPHGVIRLIEHYGVNVRGKNAVVVGKSLAVGKPLALMLLSKEATVSVCHKSTEDVDFYLKNADIVCSATGVRGLITGEKIKLGAVVIDVGIVVLDDGTIVGDVEYESVVEKAAMVTPVPGGVGPVTIAMLLENTVLSAQRNVFINSPLLYV
ncbi:MAG: bifunctional 5,10-methylenetetrahydrofolate dehydrogenase/5,10-methenyltetrahydrofolate cyclohydrolase [Candidatus Magnetoovum sp. WYHC-5]|nr:bifunctional 5,10-methylenetetrahydrofolate dehydrogenase/5,10-methenyltetrahydrofolate cyclohydrolase [Candidatus Magnetoovum sp. WYHC-5]UOH28351.1 methenyltetrahydrofolate cyclohydrolase [Candidatus Magnetoovum sp.]